MEECVYQIKFRNFGAHIIAVSLTFAETTQLVKHRLKQREATLNNFIFTGKRRHVAQNRKEF